MTTLTTQDLIEWELKTSVGEYVFKGSVAQFILMLRLQSAEKRDSRGISSQGWYNHSS